MSAEEDYTDGGPARGRASPCPPLLRVAAVLAGVVLGTCVGLAAAIAYFGDTLRRGRVYFP